MKIGENGIRETKMRKIRTAILGNKKNEKNKKIFLTSELLKE